MLLGSCHCGAVTIVTAPQWQLPKSMMQTPYDAAYPATTFLCDAQLPFLG